MLTSVVACLLLSGQAAVDVEASVRSDVRAGLSPGAAGTSVTPTADLTLTPTLRATAERHGDTATIAYAPTIQLRSQWLQTPGLLGQHHGAAGVGVGSPTRLGRGSLGANFTAGRLDLGSASRLLGNAAGASVGGSLSVADANLTGSYELRPVQRLTATANVGVNVIGVPTAGQTGGSSAAFDALAWLLLPDLAQLTPFLRTAITSQATYAVSRAWSVGGGLSTETVNQLQPTGYGGVTAFAASTLRLNRVFLLVGRLGALAGLEQDGPSLTEGRLAFAPVADLSASADVLLTRQASLNASAGASLEPTYDIFLGQLTPRAGARASVSAAYDRLSLTVNASSFSLLPSVTVGAPRTASTILPDAHVFSADAVARYAPIDGIELGAGFTSFLRGTANPAGLLAPPSRWLPELMGYGFFRAQTDLGL